MPKQPQPDYENAAQSSFVTYFFNERQQRADRDAFKRILTRQGGKEPCEGDNEVAR
jgi:hypothetical protein